MAAQADISVSMYLASTQRAVGGEAGKVGRGWGLGVQGKTGNAAAFCNLFIFSFERVKGRDRYLKPGVWPGYLGPG